ncbi:MAG: carbon storage regulator CsrA [Planctomycetaceae bacterium]
MLVLTRKINESVRIADNIEVVVLEVKHGKVRLGFRCPDDVPILRKEVYDRDAAAEPLSLLEFAALVEA